MFKSWIEAIRKGNEYRRAKYSPTETMADSYARAQEHVAWERENIHTKTRFYWPWTEESSQWCKDQDNFKNNFAFWDVWTGSRYERQENPDTRTVKDRYSVCRSNPVTGEWEKL
jgi:hypothetical protein